MAERDAAGFEMTLGNKQLFSVLFLVVVLLGVFFAMGFLAGRSGAGGTAEASPMRRPAETPPPPPKTVTEPSTPVMQDRVPSPPTEEPKTTTVTETKAAVPPDSPAPAATAAAAPTPPEPGNGVPDGRYLQASALPKAQAEAMVKLLVQDGMSSYLTLSPKKKADAPDLYRVLIGPLATSDDMAKARAYLKDKGIEKPLPRTYPDARSN